MATPMAIMAVVVALGNLSKRLRIEDEFKSRIKAKKITIRGDLMNERDDPSTLAPHEKMATSLLTQKDTGVNLKEELNSVKKN